MKLTTETKKGLTIIKLHEKRLDASIAPHFKSKLALMIEGEGEKYLVIDLSQVQGIDSSGIGSLLLAHRTTQAHDGFAAFIGVREPVRDLLKMTHLDKQLYIFNSLQDVLNNLETVETDKDEDDEEELEEEQKNAAAVATKRVNHTDLDEDEELLEDLPDLPEENIPDIDLSLEEETHDFIEPDEPKPTKKNSKRTAPKTRTRKTQKSTTRKSKKTATAKSTERKAKSKKKS